MSAVTLAEYNEACEEITTLRAEVARLRAALEPLAALADAFDNMRPPSTDATSIHAWCVIDKTGKTIDRELTVGMLRKARAANASAAKEGGG